MLKTDDSLCIGCRVCELACALQHFRVHNPKKSAIRIDMKFPDPGACFIRVCRHCGACVKVCKPGALVREGKLVVFKPEKCTRCKACIKACKYNAIFFNEQAGILKCDDCGECANFCATKALEKVA